MIEVIRTNLLTTVQDLGRHGYQHLGIATAGALDRLSLEVGNRLVGNWPNAAGFEVTFGPLVLRFLHATRVAITGTEFGATLDDKPAWSWWSLPVQAGQELTLQTARRGVRGYICVAGGIDVLPVLGSRSTDLTAQFGGLGGRALTDGDCLPLGLPAHTGIGFNTQTRAFGVKAPSWCKFMLVNKSHRRSQHPAGPPWAIPVRVLPGPDYDSFTHGARQSFWSDEWLVMSKSNRIAYRLAGTELTHRQKTELRLHAVLPGTIQVSPNGQPSVLMSDTYTTTSCYPKIGLVIRADLGKLAQVHLNDSVHFVAVTHNEARAALAEERAYLRQIDSALAMHQTYCTSAKLPK